MYTLDYFKAILQHVLGQGMKESDLESDLENEMKILILLCTL